MPDAVRRNPSLLSELSSADAQLAERALDQDEKRRGKAHDALAKTLEGAREKAHGRLRDLVGKKDWLSFRRALRESRIAMRDLLQPPEGLRRDYEQLNTARKRKAEALLKTLGINREKLTKIGLSFQEELRKIKPPIFGTVVPGFHTASNLAKWTKLSPLHLVPLPWGAIPPFAPTDPSPFSLFRLPFFDWPSRFDELATDGFEISRTQTCHGFAGFAGHDVSVTLGNSGEYGYGHGIADTRMGFIFEVPADGQVEVLVDATNASGSHDLKTENEIGWSNIDAYQTNYLSVQILHANTPDPLLAEMSHLHSTDVSANLHREFLIPGQHYYAHFISTGAVTAGRSVVILVGTQTADVFFPNDTGVDSDTSFHWLIKSVEVRIRP